MNTKHTDFYHSDSDEPHRLRTKQILSDHPEIRSFIGKNPYSFVIIVGLVGFQLSLAMLLANQPWWLVLGLAYLVGAIANHALFVMIHECTHNLVFKKRSLNILASILANVPLIVPTAVSFRKYHLKHHVYQGVYELDADLPGRWEARLVGNSHLRKALWLLLFPIVQATRPLHLRGVKHVDRWIVLNIVVQLSLDVAVYAVFGPKALMYLLLSLFFSIGLHPLGARWIQRHYLVDSLQETHSYYGRMNAFAFNVGYHYEHHDFPSVPWNKLPSIKRTAPTWYNTLSSHSSWTKLLLRFLSDRNLTLFSRAVREETADENTARIESPSATGVGASPP